MKKTTYICLALILVALTTIFVLSNPQYPFPKLGDDIIKLRNKGIVEKNIFNVENNSWSLTNNTIDKVNFDNTIVEVDINNKVKKIYYVKAESYDIIQSDFNTLSIYFSKAFKNNGDTQMGYYQNEPIIITRWNDDDMMIALCATSVISNKLKVIISDSIYTINISSERKKTKEGFSSGTLELIQELQKQRQQQ
jgi:hypothetical protein